MFKRIIVAIDGSEHSHNALEYAAKLAKQFGSTIWLVHAFPHTTDLLGYDEYEKLVGKREAAGQALLDKARVQLENSELDIRQGLLEAPEAEAILSVARARRADLIVMGTRGLGSLQGILLGSVSQKVIQHAECPVMVVR